MVDSDDDSVRFPAIGCRSRGSSSCGFDSELEEYNEMLLMIQDPGGALGEDAEGWDHCDVLLPFDESNTSGNLDHIPRGEITSKEASVVLCEHNHRMVEGLKRSAKRLRTKSSIEPRLSPVTLESAREATCDHPWVMFYLKQRPEVQELIRKKMMQRKCRCLRAYKQGEVVQLGTRRHVLHADAEEDHLVDHMGELSCEFWIHEANSASNTFAERGWCIMKLRGIVNTGNNSAFGRNDVMEAVRKSKSLLLTYQGPWGDIGVSDHMLHWNETQVAASLEDDDRIKELAECFECHYSRLKEAKKLHNYVFCIELCNKTWRIRRQCRIHVHVWILQHSGVALPDLHFRDFKCHVSVQHKSLLSFHGGRSKSAMYAAAYYCYVHKIGQIKTFDSDFKPFSSYTVKDTWISVLYQAGKISAEVARDAYLQCLFKAESNIRQLEFVEHHRGMLEQAAQREIIEKSLQSQQLPFKVIPEVVEWQRQYDELKSRHKFLVLDGPSGTGKTRYAYSLAPCPSWKTCYFADCSGGLPDLRRFNNAEHRMLFLDEMDPAVAISLKKVLQASNDPCVLGTSPTVLAAYTVCTFNTMIVVASNRWQATLQLLDKVDQDWLSKNSVFVEVKEMLFEVAVTRNGILWRQEAFMSCCF